MHLIKRILHLLSFCAFLIITYSCSSVFFSSGPKVLVFSKTKGWVHSSIPAGMAALQKLGDEHGFAVDTTKDASVFTDEKLKNYKAVIFCNTTGDVLNPEQQAAFERYIQAGGGYVGIHSAADTEYEWPWYAKLMGAHFSSHPSNPNVRKATIDVLDKSHPSTAHLPDQWQRTDEWYNYRSFYSGIHVLASLDENTYVGGTNGADHPIAWYHEFDGGRAFYTGGGHTEDSYQEPLFLAHLLAGIQYAMGDENTTLDYSKAYAEVMPEENRFVKTVLVNDLNTPMTLDISDEGKIFYTELRTANLYMFDTNTGNNQLLHRFDVATKGGTGLIGVTLDPDFTTNHWIYLYYSPPTDQEPILFNLSRFTIKDGQTLDLTSEKVLLQVPVQENSGAHHGGALAWDKEGNLYLSTGDSSSPFPSNGYAPIDERPGNESLDAQRSAANTNDLKGKILRITPQDDGTYSIPEGNLFPVGTERTRPEIFTMGLRNPYRIAVNPETSVLYWGEIGPDAGKDSLQGPRGYDEFNQAKKAGNFGWPYFVGNNYAYADWDFATDSASTHFNPDTPVNESPNNSGLKELPTTTPPMIWYPYASSEEFPELGQGGRSAMAGEFYTYHESASPNQFPSFYDGTLFVMEWMRNWVMALRFDENENFLRAEPFMTTNGDFRRPIDLTFGKDGIMYMLEYGSVYGADNDDARLVKIEYNSGNRPPIAVAGIIDTAEVAFRNEVARLTSDNRVPLLHQAAGTAPLKVNFSSRGSKDLDNDDEITYQWMFDGKTLGSNERNPTHTFTENGVYQVILKISDPSGLTDMDTINVQVGNTPPEVAIETTHNKSFFWEGESFTYHVKVNDPEDGEIPSQNVKVLFNYNPEPVTKLPNDQIGHQEESLLANLMPGSTLIANSDCKACHTIDQVSVGPSYQKVAERYKNQSGAVNQLALKIINGGAGNWGTTHVMSAHPQISTDDAQKMVEYILSLAEPQAMLKSLPLKGSLKFNQHELEEEPNGRYTMIASYTDQAANGVGRLHGKEIITLRSARVRTAFADEHPGFARWGNSLGNGDHKAFILLKDIDMNGITGFTFEYASENKEGIIEVRLDSQEGDAVSSVAYQPTGSWYQKEKVSATLDNPIDGRHDVYFVVLKAEKPNEDIINLSYINIDK